MKRFKQPRTHFEAGISGPACGTIGATQTSSYWPHVDCSRCHALRYSVAGREQLKTRRNVTS